MPIYVFYLKKYYMYTNIYYNCSQLNFVQNQHLLCSSDNILLFLQITSLSYIFCIILVFFIHILCMVDVSVYTVIMAEGNHLFTLSLRRSLLLAADESVLKLCLMLRGLEHLILVRNYLSKKIFQTLFSVKKCDVENLTLKNITTTYLKR